MKWTLTLLACFAMGYGLAWYNDEAKLKKADTELAEAIKDNKIEEANFNKELELSDRVDKAQARIKAALGLETRNDDQEE